MGLKYFVHDTNGSKISTLLSLISFIHSANPVCISIVKRESRNVS